MSVNDRPLDFLVLQISNYIYRIFPYFVVVYVPNVPTLYQLVQHMSQV